MNQVRKNMFVIGLLSIAVLFSGLHAADDQGNRVLRAIKKHPYFSAITAGIIVDRAAAYFTPGTRDQVYGWGADMFNTITGGRLLNAPQEDQRCSICLDPLVGTQLGCSHRFHRDCIMESLRQDQRCPLCRRDAGDLRVLGFTPQEIADINQGADVNAQQAVAAQVMADAGAAQQLAGNVPPVQNQNQLLIIVAATGNLQGVENALNQGADVNAIDDNGFTALMWATHWGHAAVVERLIAHGADVHAEDIDGRTALIRAARWGHAAIVEMLIAHGANVNAANVNGSTALMYAAIYGYTAIAERLIAQGANVNAADIHGITALIWAAKNGHAAVVERLIAQGANVNAVNIHGMTALMWAARGGRAAVVERLLNVQGINVNAVDRGGRTALIWAARYGHTAIVEMLTNVAEEQAMRMILYNE